MPKRLPAEAKTEALKLYLKGDKTAQEIATAVATELKVTIKPVTIYSWIKQYNWKDRGIQGERKVMEGMINLQFIQDVLNVLVEEIDNEQIINNVASKLRLLVTSRD